ncbi:tail fiber domain-containing protein [Bernardetia sp. MNP-M8]|uniref:tail fiber domain-containing protein n=1 Tax=Bernardetia sp. MNP-M8 TaxID=3127470 RepID=UPI0030D427AE
MKSFLLLLVCFICMPFYLYAQTNIFSYSSGISYQGKLMQNGQLYEGNETILFEFISENDQVKWSETQQVVIQRGLYSVVLGSNNPIENTLFSENPNLRLRIKIGDTAPMIATSLNSVPYAYMAKSVATGSVKPSSIEGGGNNKILTTNSIGEVVWLNKTDLQSNPNSLGNAGGDISGNYTNLQINDGVITTNKIADNTIETEDINTNAITTDKIQEGAITETKIQGGGNNKVLTTTGTGEVIWVDRSTFTSGSLGNAGGDLSGDYSALELKENVVSSFELSDNAVETINITNEAITESKIKKGSANTVMVTDGSGNVSWENRSNFDVTPTSLGSADGDIEGTYDALQLKENVVSSFELSDNAVETINITNEAITESKIKKGSANTVMVTDGSGNVTWEDRSNFDVTPTSLGSADGDIEGTYDALQLKENVVSSFELSDNAVETNNIENEAVTESKIKKGSANTVMVTDGSGNVSWENRSNFDVTPTSLGSADGDIEGTYDALQLKENVVSSFELSDNAVETINITNEAITEDKIKKGSANTVMVTDGSGNVSWENRSNFDVTPTSLGSADGDIEGTYDALQLKENVVSSFELSDNAVETINITNEAITESKIKKGSANTVMVTDGSGNVTWEDRSTFTSGSLGAASGDLNGTYPNLEINPNAVTSIELADYAVTSQKIQGGTANTVMITDGSGSVTWEDRSTFTSGSLGAASGDLNGTYPNLQLNANVVTTNELADNSVNSQKIQDGTITSQKIQNGSITDTKLLNGAVSELKIQNNAVTSNKIANNAITNSKITNNAVSANKIQSGGNDKVLLTSASGTVYWEDQSSFASSLPATSGDLTVNGDFLVGGGNDVIFGDASNLDDRFDMYGEFDHYGDHFHVNDTEAKFDKGINVKENSNFKDDVRIEGDLRVDGNFTNPSDIRYKRNIQTMNNSLNDILSLRGTTYYWKDTVAMNNRFQFGVIAQEVEEVFPNLVVTDENGFKSVNYIGLVPVLLQATKEQQEIIEQKETKLQELETRLEELENKLIDSEKLNAKNEATQNNQQSDTEKRLAELERMLKVLTVKNIADTE